VVKQLCPFSKVCKGYDRESFTCHDSEQEWYCGYFCQHMKFRLIAEMDKMLEGCDFADVSKV